MVAVGGIMSAAPMPWAARELISQVSDSARPHRAEQITNTTMPAIITWTRLNMSETRPANATNAASASR